MAEKKSYIYEIVIDTRSGIASLNGADIALDKLGTKIRSVHKDTTIFNKGLGQTKDASGLASAATVELGRTFSDAGYGIQGVTNNVQQLGSLFTTLMGRKNGTGGVLGFKGALDLMLKSLSGPLGAIVLFQAVTAAIEYFSRTMKSAKDEVEEFTSTLKPDITTLQALSLYSDTADGLDALKRKFKEVGEFIRNAETTGFINQDVINFAKMWGAQLLIARDNIAKLTFTMKKESEAGKITEGTAIALAEAYAAESKALRMLTTAKLEDIVVSNKGQEVRQIQEKAIVSPTTGLTLVETEGFLADELYLLAQYQYKKDQLRDKALADAKATREEDLEHRALMLEAIGDGMQSLGYVIGRETQAGKAVAAAGALIETYSAITKTLAAFSGKPIPGYAIAQAVATGLFGFAQVRKIYDVKVPRSGGGGSGQSADIPQYNPSFNVVGGSRIDQLNDTIRGELGKPARAYVVNKDVRSAGELERNIRNQGTVSG